MIKVKEIAKAIEDFAPLTLKEDWDNPGLQVGDPEMEVTGILLCLDLTEDILKEARPHMSNASWALRYVASFSNVKVILSGMSTLEQVKDNIDTLSKYEPMNAFDFETIERIKKIILGNDFIPCTGCRYCMPCPFHVDIPKIFKGFN